MFSKHVNLINDLLTMNKQFNSICRCNTPWPKDIYIISIGWSRWKTPREGMLGYQVTFYLKITWGHPIPAIANLHQYIIIKKYQLYSTLMITLDLEWTIRKLNWHHALFINAVHLLNSDLKIKRVIQSICLQ